MKQSPTTHARPRRWARRGIVATLLLGSASVLQLSSAMGAGTITLYSFPPVNGRVVEYPHHIVTGPDGMLWFTNNGEGGALPNTGSIGQMTPGGTLLNLYGCTSGCDVTAPHGITVGPDGNLWFVNKGGGTHGTGSVGKIIPTGPLAGTIQTYDDGSCALVLGDRCINKPSNIAVGPDGNLWFTNNGQDPNNAGNSIVKIDLHAPSPTLTPYSNPSIHNPKGITAGPDNSLWFTNFGREDANQNPCALQPCSIGRITTTGVVTSYFQCSGAGCSTIKEPYDIVTGPDYGLWFTNNASNIVGRLSSDGTTLTPYSHSGITGTYAMAIGGDFAIWFTDFVSATDKVGRITTTGTITPYSCDATCTGGPLSVVYGIAPGPNGSLYFTDFSDTGKIGKITTDYSVTIAPVTGTAGMTLTTVKGGGFQPNEMAISVTYDTGSGTVPLCPTPVNAGPDGRFSCTGTIPLAAGGFGYHTIKAKGSVTAKTVFLHNAG
jgi:streptogramin lyase